MEPESCNLNTSFHSSQTKITSTEYAHKHMSSEHEHWCWIEIQIRCETKEEVNAHAQIADRITERKTAIPELKTVETSMRTNECGGGLQFLSSLIRYKTSKSEPRWTRYCFCPSASKRVGLACIFISTRGTNSNAVKPLLRRTQLLRCCYFLEVRFDCFDCENSIWDWNGLSLRLNRFVVAFVILRFVVDLVWIENRWWIWYWGFVWRWWWIIAEFSGDGRIVMNLGGYGGFWKLLGWWKWWLKVGEGGLLG
jgi:hypothetical protein